jgi:hypothetical protein
VKKLGKHTSLENEEKAQKPGKKAWHLAAKWHKSFNGTFRRVVEFVGCWGY